MDDSKTDNIRTPQPKILVLGATGGTGCLIVSQAVARGYEVTVLVRSAVKAEARPRHDPGADGSLRLPRRNHIARRCCEVCPGPTAKRYLATSFSVDHMVNAILLAAR